MRKQDFIPFKNFFSKSYLTQSLNENHFIYPPHFRGIAMTAMFAATMAGWSQNVVIDFQKEAQLSGGTENITKGDNVRFTFVGSTDKTGAYINSPRWASVYFLRITAPRDIAVIEYQTQTKNAKNDDASVTVGSVTRMSNGTCVWRGPASEVTITGATDNTNFSITRLRLWFNESEYDPNASWDAQGGQEGEERPYQVNINFDDDKTDYTAIDRVYSSVNVLPVEGRGVPMAVVADRKFWADLQPYLEWKTQQGYEVKEVYTDEITGGKQGQELAFALRQRLMDMVPRPSYVLLVGGAAEVPPFMGTTYASDHASDCYYGEFTDDHFADAYVGRFSASTVAELRAQLDKTKYMATISPVEGEWLKHSVTVDDVIDNIAAMKESVKLSSNYPYNYEGNTVEVLKASYTETINSQINNGCSFVNYFGHGLTPSWSGAYNTSHVSQLTNKNRYPVVMSMTCYTGTFDVPGCLAEAFMRKENAGAVAVIAASRTSFAHTNNALFLGVSSGQKSTTIGMFRSLFPYVGSDLSQRARTIGQALDIGCLAVTRFSLSEYNGVREFYNLFGDPTYQPYITRPKANKLSSSSYNIIVGRNVTVNTVPDAMVCLSQGRTVIAAVMADAKGKALLHVPASTKLTGDCVLYTSAPGYSDLSRKVTLSAGSGTEEMGDESNVLPATTHTDVISIATVGNAVQDNWQGSQQTFSGNKSKAQYAIMASSEKYANSGPRKPWIDVNTSAKGIYLRDNYNLCSLITTRSGGKARTVKVDWLYPTGNGETIGVYGSNTAYSSTTDAWEGNRQGKKLGELVKGCNDSLTVSGDYAFLLFRAESHKEYPNDEQSDVYFKSLAIGWETELPQCEKPEIIFEDGQFQFNCATKGATYSYGVAPATMQSDDFVLSVVAQAPGYRPSEKATFTIAASELVDVPGDIDGNGTISIADIVKLVKSLNK